MSKVDKAYLKQLVETPSVTGTETRIASVVRERLSEVADEIETNVMGSVHARLVGSGSAPSVMIAAHMDEVGLMVTHISDQGFLSVAAVGGVDAAILPGMRVDVHTSTETLRGVVGRKPIHLIEADERKKVTPLTSLVIDLAYLLAELSLLLKWAMLLPMVLVLKKWAKVWRCPAVLTTKRACTLLRALWRN